jgi:hypothetical protein
MRTFKMMIVGDKGIGRVQLVPEHDGLHYTDNELTVAESNVKFEILDYGSSFDELIEANIVILVTSVFNRSRIVIQSWITCIRSKCKVGTPILICVSMNDWFVDDVLDLDHEVMYKSFRLPYLPFVPEITSVNGSHALSKRAALTKSIELIYKYERRVRKSNHIKVNHMQDICNDIKFCVRSFF